MVSSEQGSAPARPLRPTSSGPPFSIRYSLANQAAPIRIYRVEDEPRRGIRAK